MASRSVIVSPSVDRQSRPHITGKQDFIEVKACVGAVLRVFALAREFPQSTNGVTRRPRSVFMEFDRAKQGLEVKDTSDEDY
ncbi:hypothetical protein EN35_21010 [Rhodococcus qingshengii]|nr:hypothetical protein EN35_21010 [Rhodococcus qingshengii]